MLIQINTLNILIQKNKENKGFDEEEEENSEEEDDELLEQYLSLQKRYNTLKAIKKI